MRARPITFRMGNEIEQPYDFVGIDHEIFFSCRRGGILDFFDADKPFAINESGAPPSMLSPDSQSR
jgi:hypothetical protein